MPGERLVLAEFLRSRELYPTRSATKNMAICLRKLQRFDEALEAFEALINEFPDLPREDRAFAEQNMSELRALVGFIDIRGAEPGATVNVDGRNRGVVRAGLPIRVSAGRRTVRIDKAGFGPLEERVEVLGEQTVVLEARMVKLATSGPSARAKGAERAYKLADEPKSRLVIELVGGAVVAPSFGGTIVDDCAAPCSSSLGAGFLGRLHIAYETTFGISFGLSGGFLTATQDTMSRFAELTPAGRPANPGNVDDSLRLGGALVGATVAWNARQRFPLALRLGAGAMVGSLVDNRSGTFQSSLGRSYYVELADSSAARYFYIDPEIRIGVRFMDHFELSLGAQALILLAITGPQADPRNRIQLSAPDDGRVMFGFGPDEQQTGGAMVFVVPNLGLRADF